MHALFVVICFNSFLKYFAVNGLSPHKKLQLLNPENPGNKHSIKVSVLNAGNNNDNDSDNDNDNYGNNW